MAELGPAFVVLGTFRSGTSAVAAVLSNMGAYFGDTGSLIPADPANELGYFEHIGIARIHRQLFAALNLPGVDGGGLPHGWEESPRIPALRTALTQLLQQDFMGRGNWAYKDPQTCLTVPFDLDVLRASGVAPRFIICVRNPLDVAASEFDRTGVPVDATLGVWLLNTLTALVSTAGCERIVVIYDELVQGRGNAFSELARIAPELDLSRAKSAIEPRLQHHREDLSGLKAMHPIIDQTYSVCTEFASSGDTDHIKHRITDLWERWDRTEFFPEMPFGQVTVNGYENGPSAPYAIGGAWQKVNLVFPDAPTSEVSVELTAPPSTLWIRNALWRHAGGCQPAEGPSLTQNSVSEFACRYLQPNLCVRTPSIAGPATLEFDLLAEFESLGIHFTF